MEHIGLYLNDIYFNKKNGRLVFSYKGIQKYLFFRDGFLIFTKTNQVKELLGEFLYKMRKISEDVYSKIDHFIEPMQSIGKALVKNGIISKEDLHAGLMYQMRETTLNLFPIFGGNFKFQEKGGFTEGEFGTKINVPDLIEEGIRRMNYHLELKKFMEKKVLFPKTKDCLERLTEEERGLLGMLDGSQTAGALLRSKRFRSRPFWKSIYLFYCLNLVGIQGGVKVSEKKEKVKKPPPEDQEKKVAEVLALSAALPTLSSHQILNIPSTASQREVKLAYFQLARKYHPDCFDQNLPSDIKEKIEDVFGRITKAYRKLTSGKESPDYEVMTETPSELDKLEVDKRAEIKFRQAKTLYTQERYEEALVYLEEVIRLKRDKGSYTLLLAMTEMKLPSFREKAEEDFLRAIELEPWNAEAYAGLGVFYKKEGLLVKANKMFKKALEIEPEHKLSIKELNDMAEGPDKKKGLKGIFGFGHLGKKKKKS